MHRRQRLQQLSAQPVSASNLKHWRKAGNMTQPQRSDEINIFDVVIIDVAMIGL